MFFSIFGTEQDYLKNGGKTRLWNWERIVAEQKTDRRARARTGFFIFTEPNFKERMTF